MLKRIFPSLLVVLIFLSACAPQPTPAPTATTKPLTQIRLPMGYIPNVQFAPFYMAVERGLYNDAGINVQFDYSNETDGVALVGANKLQFAIVSGEQVLLARAQGLPIVYVMAWYQKYPVSIISRADQNIQAPQDLKGKKIGLPGLFGASYIGLRALLYTAGLKESDVTLDSIGYNQVQSLTAGQDLIVVGYADNEPVILHSKGVDVNELRVADYVELASNGIITNEATIAQNPDLVRNFVSATLQGIQDTIADPDTAYDVSKKYVPNLDQADTAVQKQILGTSIELWRAAQLGYSDPKSWTNMQQVLLNMGLYTKPLDVSKAYSNDFLPK